MGGEYCSMENVGGMSYYDPNKNYSSIDDEKEQSEQPVNKPNNRPRVVGTHGDGPKNVGTAIVQGAINGIISPFGFGCGGAEQFPNIDECDPTLINDPNGENVRAINTKTNMGVSGGHVKFTVEVEMPEGYVPQLAKGGDMQVVVYTNNGAIVVNSDGTMGTEGSGTNVCPIDGTSVLGCSPYTGIEGAVVPIGKIKTVSIDPTDPEASQYAVGAKMLKSGNDYAVWQQMSVNGMPVYKAGDYLVVEDRVDNCSGNLDDPCTTTITYKVVDENGKITEKPASVVIAALEKVFGKNKAADVYYELIKDPRDLALIEKFGQAKTVNIKRALIASPRENALIEAFGAEKANQIIAALSAQEYVDDYGNLTEKFTWQREDFMLTGFSNEELNEKDQTIIFEILKEKIGYIDAQNNLTSIFPGSADGLAISGYSSEEIQGIFNILSTVRTSYIDNEGNFKTWFTGKREDLVLDGVSASDTDKVFDVLMNTASYLDQAYTLYSVDENGKYLNTNEGMPVANPGLASKDWEIVMDENYTFQDVVFGNNDKNIGSVYAEDGTVGVYAPVNVSMKVVDLRNPSQKEVVDDPAPLAGENETTGFVLSRKFYSNGQFHYKVVIEFESNTPLTEMTYVYGMNVGGKVVLQNVPKSNCGDVDSVELENEGSEE